MTSSHKLIILLLYALKYLSACEEPLSEYKTAHISQVRFSDDKIIDKDLNKNLFQLRVLNQAPKECTAHQERNLLFMLDALESTKENELDTKYKQMLDNNLYEEMMSNAVCELSHPTRGGDVKHKKPKPGGKRIRRSPDLKKLIDENPDFPKYLPINSKYYLDRIIKFSRHVNFPYYKKIKSLIEKHIANIEQGEVLSNYISGDTAELTENSGGMLDNNAAIIHLAQAINSVKDITVPLAITLNSVGHISHATSMIVRRKAGKMAFYFMDPLNWKVSNTETYKKTLYPLIRFFEDKEYFKKSLIRSGYFAALYEIENNKKSYIANPLRGIKPWDEYMFFPFFDYLEILLKLDLIDDVFFKKHYKTPLCNLIKAELDDTIEVTTERGNYDNPIPTKHPDAKKELLTKFACDKH